MIRRLTQVLVMAGAMVVTVSSMASAQLPTGYMDIGPALSVGGIGDAGIAYGARFETVFTSLPDLGGGTLGIEASVDHYSYNFNSVCSDCGFSYTPIGATVNYHVKLDTMQWDPYIGLGLGDYIVSHPSCAFCTGFNSGIYVIGRAGLRYRFSDSWAAKLEVGSGAGSLQFSLNWILNKGK
jgi:hypothetical protein